MPHLIPARAGFLGDKKRHCICSPQQISRYLDKLSGPLLDRIDVQINVQSIDYDTIKNQNIKIQTSQELFEGVQQALDMQAKRFGTDAKWNAHMLPDDVENYCILTESAEKLLKIAFEKLNLSMRGYHKILKVARTVADLEQSTTIDIPHIQEAIMYRSLDQNLERPRS